jgi:predicted nucleic acid-binding protein
MSFVIDSSVALAWLLPDERGQAADALADRLVSAPTVAPAIWPLEVANALMTARRRDRIADRDVDRMLEVLFALPVDVEPPSGGDTLARVVAIARRHAITTYDAAYVELAKRRGWPLATLDARLKTACGSEGVGTLP